MEAERYFVSIPLHTRPEDPVRGAADLGGVGNLLRDRLRALDPRQTALPPTPMAVDVFQGVASLLLLDCSPEHLRVVVASGVRYSAMAMEQKTGIGIHWHDEPVRLSRRRTR